MVGVPPKNHHPLGLHRMNHIKVGFVDFEWPKKLGIAALRLPSAAPITSCDHAHNLLPQGLHWLGVFLAASCQERMHF